MPSYTIAILKGDAIGPEIMDEALKVLRALEKHTDLSFTLNYAAFGASAYVEHGHPFPEETQAICLDADAVLKGPVGLAYQETESIPIELRPERAAILPLRRLLNTYANIRPVALPKDLAHFSPLKHEIVGDGIDIILVRELVGGLYFGNKEVGVNKHGNRYVKETLEYDEVQIKQILHVAFKQAQLRKKVLHNIHKNNVLKSSVLWNTIVDEIATNYPEITVVHQLVDSAASLLCLNPRIYDVMVMENMFGDILSDQGGGIIGSLGLMPSACLGDKNAYYEPSHGSAPDIAGKNIANPYSMIGSLAMMLEYSFARLDESKRIWKAIQTVYSQGFVTADLYRAHHGMQLIATDAFGDRVVDALNESYQ